MLAGRKTLRYCRNPHFNLKILFLAPCASGLINQKQIFYQGWCTVNGTDLINNNNNNNNNREIRKVRSKCCVAF